ncbi:uncharacterized protein KY384_007881 [Bacidia gigantensis]|uniref:uncharacterized protein n=1 Tax=Bacidia gigantensis TaxID=2732470 RepID=UPI001D03F74D|nr:uncharacterized protein KY384_007881 [Bacidia gigantensis]KAG8527727.1 hypothetical protein KY384_007881 [Bacidia gigantensis]
MPDHVSQINSSPTSFANVPCLGGGKTGISRETYDVLYNFIEAEFSPYFWSKSICINLNDPQEKATQIALMRRVIASASDVQVWLQRIVGTGTYAFDCIRNWYAGAGYGREGGWDESMMMNELRSGQAEAAVCGSVLDFFLNPWFTSVWNVPEVVKTPIYLPGSQIGRRGTQYSASGETPINCKRAAGESIWIVSGTIVDDYSDNGVDYPGLPGVDWGVEVSESCTSTMKVWIQQLRDLIGASQSDAASANSDDRLLMRRLITGCDEVEVENISAGLKLWQDLEAGAPGTAWYQSLCSENRRILLRFFEATMLPHMLSKIICTSNRRLLGTVPRSLQYGDAICIIHGSRYPCVLRPTENPEEWKLVGKCYIEWLMHGEGLEMSSKQEFVII